MFGKKRFFLFDESGAGGDSGTDNGTGATNTGDDAGAAAKNAGDATKDGKTQKVTFTPEQQAAVDQIVKDRLAREKKKSDEDAERARKQAEEDALLKNQEFEKLATDRKKALDDLQVLVNDLLPLKDQVERYRTAMETSIKAQIEKLPAAVKVLLEKLDPIEQSQYLAAHAKELGVEFKPVPETDTGSSSGKLSKDAEERAKQTNAKLVKGFFH